MNSLFLSCLLKGSKTALFLCVLESWVIICPSATKLLLVSECKSQSTKAAGLIQKWTVSLNLVQIDWKRLEVIESESLFSPEYNWAGWPQLPKLSIGVFEYRRWMDFLSLLLSSTFRVWATSLSVCGTNCAETDMKDGADWAAERN